MPASEAASLTEALTEVKERSEKERVKKALAMCCNNISKTAKELGVSRPTVYGFLRKYSISLPKPIKRSSKN